MPANDSADMDRFSLSRRRALATAGVGIAVIAGCSGDVMMVVVTTVVTAVMMIMLDGIMKRHSKQQMKLGKLVSVN